MRTLTRQLMRHLNRQGTLRSELAAALRDLREAYRHEVRLAREVRMQALLIEQVTRQRDEAVALARRLQAEMANMVGEL